MRNTFGGNPRNILTEYDSSFANSPDQISIVWNAGGDIVGAWPISRDGSSSWEIDIEHFQSDFNLASAINLRRGSRPDVPSLSHETLFLTAIPDFSERTRILALDGERLALDDNRLVEWLINAEQQVVLGTDSHPLFETSLEDTACSITRLPNGQVAMTEVPRVHVEAARERFRVILGDRVSSQLDLWIGTPIRATARYFLTAMKEGELVQRPGKESEVTAFILIERSGFSFGLWSPAAGLFSEYGFLAPKDIAQNSIHRSDASFLSTSMPGIDSQQRVEAYIQQAFDQLSLQLSKEKLEQLQLSGYAQVVWASEPALTDLIAPIASEHAASTGIECFHLEAPADEAIVGGLLLGSFAFGGETVVGAELLPPINLARDLLALADTEESQRRQNEELYAKKKRSKAAFAMLAAPVITLACLLAILSGLILSGVLTGIREARANARIQELKPALDRRNSYEANLKWYQEFIKQVSRLRKQQPVGIGLLYQLNSNYPFSVDPSFYVSNMKLDKDGSLEIKGFARNKDAVVSFLKALEYAGGPESGSRLFGSLRYEVQEGAPVTPGATGQQSLPAMTGSALGANATRPGISAWSLNGNYLPMAEFAPPPPPKPGATQPAPGASPPAAAASPKPAG